MTNSSNEWVAEMMSQFEINRTDDGVFENFFLISDPNSKFDVENMIVSLHASLGSVTNFGEQEIIVSFVNWCFARRIPVFVDRHDFPVYKSFAVEECNSIDDANNWFDFNQYLVENDSSVAHKFGCYIINQNFSIEEFDDEENAEVRLWIVNDTEWLQLKIELNDFREHYTEKNITIFTSSERFAETILSMFVLSGRSTIIWKGWLDQPPSKSFDR